MPSESSANALRNIVFGVEDSLVSTVGLLSGIAAADATRYWILVTGVVLIFVEAFSMAVGSLLSETMERQYRSGHTVGLHRSLRDGVLMFISYFISGFIPLIPYVLLPPSSALPVSIIWSLAALGVLGIAGARAARLGDGWHQGLRMMTLGGVAIFLGLAVGKISTL